jgi:hypothetical protein
VAHFLPGDIAPPNSPNSLWKFAPSANGSGSWSEQSLSSDSIFPSLTRPAGGTDAYRNGTGYLLGGYQSFRSSPETASLDDMVPMPGIVSYNIESGTWRNDSAKGFSMYGTAMYGKMQFVSTFGPEDLLLIMGGKTSDAVTWIDTAADYVSFRKVDIFDPSTSTWHKQNTSGTIPNARDRFCSIGAQGDNSS